jgi:hypothetical protein
MWASNLKDPDCWAPAYKALRTKRLVTPLDPYLRTDARGRIAI